MAKLVKVRATQLEAKVQFAFPEPIWWEERINSSKFSSDLQMCTMMYVYMYLCVHTQNNRV